MKKKIVKKLIAAAMATTMTMSLAACGGEGGGESTPDTTPDAGKDTVESAGGAGEVAPSTEAAGGEDELGGYTVLKDENGNTYDLGGMEIVIRDWWTADEEVVPTDDYEEARENYYDWIQETYNFTIKTVAISSWSSTPQDFADYASTGGDDANYVFTLRQGTELTQAMNQGLMFDLSTLDCLDFSEAKWVSGIHEMFAKGKSIYGMRGIAPEPRGGLYFNKRILTEANIDPADIYKWQEDGTWTWDKFEELCETINADTDNDGVIDRYALVCVNQDLYPMAVYSNGGEYVGKDENGKYYNDVESAETIEALDWALDMIDSYAKVFAADAEWNYAYTAFKNGEGAFLPQEAYYAGDNYTDMVDDYGFVCFPKGPKADDYTNCYNDNVYAIPACYDADRAWKIAFAYNLYTDPVPGFEDYATWKTDYYKEFRDLESVDLTLARMTTNGMITYHTLIPNLKINNDLHWGINKDNTPAQKTESIRNTWNQYIEDANK